MGRHHLKLPEHLYISPPSPQPTSTFASASSFFTLKAGLPYKSTPFFLQHSSTTRVFERRIPGFRISAAFLAALRANLDLEIDNFESPADTPDTLRPLKLTSTSTIPPPSPLVQAMSTSQFTDADFAPSPGLVLPKSSTVEAEEEVDVKKARDPNAIPELATFPANDDASRTEALRLVADSVAQQRQRASRALIFHPLTIAILATAFALLRQYFYKGATSDYAIIATTWAGIFMTILVAVRAKTSAYIEEAERVGTWRWLGEGRSSGAEEHTGKRVLGDQDDEILITKFGNEHIGAIVFRGVQTVEEQTSTSKKSRKSNNSTTLPRTEIRAWTVRQRFRNKGVGAALLEDAIKLAHERGWAQGGIEVAVDHANNKVVLPKIFSGFVQSNDERTRKFVERKVKEYEENNASSGKGKRRR